MDWCRGRNQVLCVLVVLFTTCSLGRGYGDNNRISELDRRNLEDYDGYFQYDLADYSLRFERCQYVKMYDDDLAQDEDSDSPLAVKHLVVFRLCPSDSCDDSSCYSLPHGNYVADVENYLKYTVEAQEKAFETMCESCQEKCNDDGQYCSGCGKLCYRYENLEDSGYVDAANYIECQKLEMNNDDDRNGQDDDFQLYIGPRCSQDGSKILIGLFSDEDCLDPYTDEDASDYVGGKISYHLLSHTYNDDGSVCLSCKEDDEDENEADQEDADDVNEMCEDIYNLAAKCESKHGIEGGFIQIAREDGDYENQVENEFMACTFIESLMYNSYTETGDINIDDEQDLILRDVTAAQKVTMAFITLSFVGLFFAAFYTQKQIENATPKVDLACQTDAQIT